MSNRPVVIGRPTARQVAFVGPFGVGKTTAVRALSSVPVTSAEAATSHVIADQADKTTTTVGIDHGRWDGPAGRISLAGTPGQSRFQLSRDRVVATANGVVLWLFGNRENALTEAEQWLDVLDAKALAGRLSVAVTRAGTQSADALAPYRELLARYGSDIELYLADPRDAADVARLVLSALRISPAPAAPPASTGQSTTIGSHAS